MRVHVNPLIRRLEQIKTLQDAVEEAGKIESLFFPAPIRDTIPVVFFLNNGSVFQSSGGIGRRDEKGHFTTPFFRIETISDSFMVTLTLLKPHYGQAVPEDLFDVYNLIKTGFCVEMNSTVFGGVQYLDSKLVEVKD
ncbi:hypothetical protein [Metabacillus sp. 84]|uniref:hypothetical protein n=1 Tax=unclassified Metabacillus TaxID=2675274 RepID=UPI003CFA61F7